MSDKKKKAAKKSNKYDITIKVDATFDELLKAGLGLPPKEKKEDHPKAA